MVLPIYLAMTFAEYYSILPKSSIAWMGAFFSSYHEGLSNLPQELPAGSILMVDDRLLPNEHRPESITDDLLRCQERTGFESIILDFQNSYNKSCALITEHICSVLECPVTVTPNYTDHSSGPVLLPPLCPDIPFEEFAAPFKGREIWLELTNEKTTYTVTHSGCTIQTTQDDLENDTSFTDDTLCCSYQINLSEDSAKFTMFRNLQNLEQLLKKHSCDGLTRMIGLYTEWTPFYLSTSSHRMITERN